jgi:hypothetical protein
MAQAEAKQKWGVLPMQGAASVSYLPREGGRGGRSGRVGRRGSDALVDRECLPQLCSAFAGISLLYVALADAFQRACFLTRRADVAGYSEGLGVVVAGPIAGRISA